jgi:hypothetical protein
MDFMEKIIDKSYNKASIVTTILIVIGLVLLIVNRLTNSGQALFWAGIAFAAIGVIWRIILLGFLHLKNLNK